MDQVTQTKLGLLGQLRAQGVLSEEQYRAQVKALDPAATFGRARAAGAAADQHRR